MTGQCLSVMHGVRQCLDVHSIVKDWGMSRVHIAIWDVASRPYTDPHGGQKVSVW